MTTSCGHQPSASHINTNANNPQGSNIVTLQRLEVPPLSSLFPSEYREWGLCGTCGIQTHEVFVRRDGSSSSSSVTTSTTLSACADTDTNTDNACDESNDDADDSAGERVQLPITIPGKIQLGRCLKCRPRRKKQHNRKASRSGNQSRTNSTRRRSRRNLNEVNEEEPGTDDEVSDKSLFPDLLAENDGEDDNEPHANAETDENDEDNTSTSNRNDNDHNNDDDASTVITAITTSPALLSTPHPLTKNISHISHISHGSEPSQSNQSLQTESSESSEETLWSVQSGESEDSILRRVVSFAANTTTATCTTNVMHNGNTAPATATDNNALPSPPRSALRYKRRTQDHESIGTSIATSLMSSHASFSSNSSSSSEEEDVCCSSDEDTIVSGNCSPDRFNAKRKSVLKEKLASGPPMPLSGTHRARSAPATVPGKLAREWNHGEDDPLGAYLTSRGKRNISLPTNIDCMSGLERNGSTGIGKAQTSSQCRPKWTARSAILTHEEELQVMLQQQCSRKGATADANDSDGDESTIDSTSGDIGCMAARLRKQYGIHRISFASGASTTSSSTDSSTSSSNCSGDSGKASSLLSGITASTTTNSSHTDDASSTSSSSSRWMTQSQMAEKKSWNRKVMGFFAADKILGRHRATG